MLKNKKLIISSLILGVLLIISAYLFSFPLKANKLESSDLIEFNEENFVKVQKREVIDGEVDYIDVLTDQNKKVSENSDFVLYLDETTSHFKVEDKNSGLTWRSNPETPTLDAQRATLSIVYMEGEGNSNTRKSINNYKTSINHDPSVDYDKGIRRTYSINYIDNGFQILYELTNLDINYLYIPRFLTAEIYNQTVEALLERYNETLDFYDYDLYLTFRDNYQKDAFNEELFQIIESSYENMSRTTLSDLYDIFYPTDSANRFDFLGVYSLDRVQEENAQYGYFKEFDIFNIQVATQVVLTEFGVETNIIRNSIKESRNISVTEINLYPYFGAVPNFELDGTPSVGEIVIPDGSGAVINFNNEKGGETNAYRVRVYGDDLAMAPYNNINRNDLIFPIFGMVYQNSGFAAIISNGDAMASINANTSSTRTPFNVAYASFELREKETITLGTVTRRDITLVTKDIVDTDFGVSFYILDNENSNYTGIAKSYRDYLIENYNLTKKDNTTNSILTLELLGAYDQQEFFLGVPYTTQQSLTTFKEAVEIVENLKKLGVSEMSILYNGALNGGINPENSFSSKIEKVLGGKKGYQQMETRLDELGVDLSVSVELIAARDFNKPFDNIRYTSRRISKANSVIYSYDKSTELFEENSVLNRYAINPSYYESLYNRFDRRNVIDGLQFEYLGNSLTGNYQTKNMIYRQDAVTYQRNLFEKMDDKNIVLRQPLGFAIPYADYIVDLPVSTTLYTIIDYSIPLVQLVLNGYIDYSIESINLSSSRSTDYLFLKAIETGSNLKYTITKDSSEELLNTPYNNYLSTTYANWEETMVEQYKEINSLGIYNSELINHKRISHDVFQVEYANGTVITINYNPNSVNYNGNVIPGLSYYKEVK